MEREDRTSKETGNRQADVRRLLLLLVFAGVMLAGCLVLNGFTWLRLQHSSEEQNLGQQRLAQLSLVLTILQDIEMSQRGYLISGDEDYLADFESARKEYMDQWPRMLELENQDLQKSTKFTEEMEAVDELVKWSIESIFVRQNEGHEAAVRRYSDGRNHTLMAEVRELYQKRISDTDNQIRERRELTKNDFQAGLATSIAMGLLAFGIGGISLVMLKKVLKEMKRSERYALNMLRAEEAKRQKDVFLAMMSHEIRTPLNAIIGFGELASHEEMGETAKRYVRSILNGGNSLLVLINDILDLSKLEAGRMHLNPEPTNLRELLKFMERIFRETCMAKGVQLSVECADEIPDSLVLDSSRLRQVLMNLMGNAVKFTENGEIKVIASGHSESHDSSKWRLKIEVRDCGVGISSEDLERVFEPFYQTVARQDKHTPGTGLGLSIVKRFVELMDGRISVDSQVGVGSHFMIELPNRAVSVRLASEGPGEVSFIDFNQLAPATLLVADDNATNLELMCEIFRNTHHQILTAANGQEALDAIEKQKPDLVLMDLRMPLMDGPTATKTIKASPATKLLPVIAVTAGSLPGESDRVEELDIFDSSLKKPFSRHELYQALSLFLKSTASVEAEQNEDEEIVGEIDAAFKAKLEAMIPDVWEELRAKMLVSEVLDFAQSLTEEAESESCGILAIYASKLKDAAQSYSFGRMETVLDRFPKLVAGLKIKDSSPA